MTAEGKEVLNGMQNQKNPCETRESNADRLRFGFYFILFIFLPDDNRNDDFSPGRLNNSGLFSLRLTVALGERSKVKPCRHMSRRVASNTLLFKTCFFSSSFFFFGRLSTKLSERNLFQDNFLATHTQMCKSHRRDSARS